MGLLPGKASAVKKLFLNEESVIQDAFRLGVAIFKSGFDPTFIIGLWRGGSTVAVYIQECLQTLGMEADHAPLRVSCCGSFSDQNGIAPPGNIRVDGIDSVIRSLNTDDRLLIVDDVFRTGQYVQAVTRRLQSALKSRFPKQVKVATLWQTNQRLQTAIQPDYCLHTTDDRVVFPYELRGLSEEEIRQHKPLVASLSTDIRK